MHAGWHLLAPMTRWWSRPLRRAAGNVGNGHEESANSAEEETDTRPIVLSRSIRRQLSDLVATFEQASGCPVRDSFTISIDRRGRVMLRSGSRSLTVPFGTSAHRLATEALARFSADPVYPANLTGKGQHPTLSISSAGIFYTQGH